MDITAFIERENKEVTTTLEDPLTVEHLLKTLNINPVTVIVAKNGEVCTNEEKIGSQDNIKIISVISGG